MIYRFSIKKVSLLDRKGSFEVGGARTLDTVCLSPAPFFLLFSGSSPVCVPTYLYKYWLLLSRSKPVFCVSSQ